MCAISLPASGSGTLGLIVRKDEPPHDLGLLTAAHVVIPAGSAVAPILQPGASDGGLPTDKIADLGAFVLPSLGRDAAFGMLTTPRRLNVRPCGFTAPVAGITPSHQVAGGMEVKKSGFATGVTVDVIEAVGTIKYEPIPGSPRVTVRGFEIQNKPGVTTWLSRFGDSGSVWVDVANSFGVGLHVAGEPNPDPAQGDRAFACFLAEIFEDLHIELIPPAEVQSNLRFTNEDARRV